MSNFPINQWMTIEAYRDFWDVPHLIFLRQTSGLCWIVDHRIVAPSEEFHPHALLFSGSTIADFQSPRKPSPWLGHLVGSTPFDTIEFDSSKRLRLRVMGPIFAVDEVWADFRDMG